MSQEHIADITLELAEELFVLAYDITPYLEELLGVAQFGGQWEILALPAKELCDNLSPEVLLHTTLKQWIDVLLTYGVKTIELQQLRDRIQNL